MAKYTFVTKQNQDSFNIPIPTSTKSYYQMAQFSNQTTKLYHVKKFKIDTTHTILKVTDHNIKKSQWEQLQKQKKINEYKLFPVYSLKTIPPPSGSDIHLLMSNMLSSNNDFTKNPKSNYNEESMLSPSMYSIQDNYTGFAQF